MWKGACMVGACMVGVCMAVGAWQGACMAGSMHDRGTHVPGVCVVGVCMACMPPTGYYEIWSVNAWVVRILLDCILVEESILYGATPCKQMH